MKLAAVAALLVVLVAGCSGETRSLVQVQDPLTRLQARPGPGDGGGRCAPGTHTLVGGNRKALMRVTPPARNGRLALLLALHGAGSGGAPGGLYAFRGVWNIPGLVLVAPAAAGSAWTLGRTDVGFVDRSLRLAFARCRVRSDRVLVGGFSSGAGMALWLGLTNGDLFDAIVSLSPGGSLPAARVGKPAVYLAHGTRDDVIPIAVGGDVVAERLRAAGYRVRYVRFAGGHRPDPGIVRGLVRRATG